MDSNRYCKICTITASTMHLLVDCLCVCSLYLLYATHNINSIITAIFIYNIIAFGTQPFTGIIADRIKQREILLYTSVTLLATAVIVTDFCTTHKTQPFMAAALLGLGNSLFHVWGGKQTAEKSNNDILSLGIFVSTGALGLSVGYLFHSHQLLYATIMLIALLSFAYTAIETKETYAEKRQQPGENIKAPHKLLFIFAAMLVLSAIVAGRSFISEEFSSTMTKGKNIILLIGIISTAGKMAGGAITECIGLKSTIALLLIGTLLCYPLRQTSIFTALAGLFIINCTMPITLYLANRVLKGREGLAFGILAAALVPGYIIAIL